jgi:hypothetical protein
MISAASSTPTAASTTAALSEADVSAIAAS